MSVALRKRGYWFRSARGSASNRKARARSAPCQNQSPHIFAQILCNTTHRPPPRPLSFPVGQLLNSRAAAVGEGKNCQDRVNRALTLPQSPCRPAAIPNSKVTTVSSLRTVVCGAPRNPPQLRSRREIPGQAGAGLVPLAKHCCRLTTTPECRRISAAIAAALLRDPRQFGENCPIFAGRHFTMVTEARIIGLRLPQRVTLRPHWNRSGPPRHGPFSCQTAPRDPILASAR